MLNHIRSVPGFHTMVFSIPFDFGICFITMVRLSSMYAARLLSIGFIADMQLSLKLWEIYINPIRIRTLYCIRFNCSINRVSESIRIIWYRKFDMIFQEDRYGYSPWVLDNNYSRMHTSKRIKPIVTEIRERN